MSTAVGENKRVVSKQNKSVKTANIKVSTGDNGITSTNNKTTEKSPNKNKTSTGKNALTDKTDKNIFQQTKDLEDILKTLKAEKEKSENSQFGEIKNLNKSISQLNKKHKDLYKINYSLISKLKDMQNNFTKEFDNKFKMSKIVSKQKKAESESDLNIQIKAKEMEIQMAERKGEFIQQQYERLEKLENEGKEESLKLQLDDLKSQIEEHEKIVNDLKEKEKAIKKEDFEKNYEELKNKYKVLQNSIEFENKKKEMDEKKEKEEEEKKKKLEEEKKKLKVEKKKKKEEKRKALEDREKNGREEKFLDGIKVGNGLPLIERMREYGKEVRKEELKDAQDYDGKEDVKIKKIWNNFSKELNELDENSLTSRQNKMSKSGNLKTSGNVEKMFSSYKSYYAYLKKMTSRIDTSTPTIHIFSEKEKGVMKKYMSWE